MPRRKRAGQPGSSTGPAGPGTSGAAGEAAANRQKAEAAVESGKPPIGRAGNPEMTAPRVPHQVHPRFYEPKRGVACAAEDLRQHGHPAGQQQSQPAQHGALQRNPEQGVEQRGPKSDEVESGHHQRQDHEPHHGPHGQRLPQPAEHGRCGPGRNRWPRHQPRDRFLFAARRRAGTPARRTTTKQPPTETTTAPGAEEVGRVDRQHDHRRGREKTEGLAPASQGHGQAGAQHEDRRPDHRRLGIGQQHVSENHRGDRRQRRRAGGHDPAEDEPQSRGENPHVNAGNHQEVNGAGLHEGRGLLRVELFPGAQQHGGGQRRLLRAHVTCQQPEAPSPGGVDQSARRPERQAIEDRHPLRMARPEHRSLPVCTEVLGVVELPGVHRPRRRHEAREDQQPVAGADLRHATVNEQLGLARGRTPSGAVAHAADFDGQAGLFLGREGAQRVRRGRRHDPRTALGHDLQADRLLPSEAALPRSPRKQVPPAMMPCPARSGRSQKEHHRSGPLMLPSPEEQPRSQGRHGRRPPQAERQAVPAIGRDPGGHCRCHGHQRLVVRGRGGQGNAERQTRKSERESRNAQRQTTKPEHGPIVPTEAPLGKRRRSGP